MVHYLPLHKKIGIFSQLQTAQWIVSYGASCLYAEPDASTLVYTETSQNCISNKQQNQNQNSF